MSEEEYKIVIGAELSEADLQKIEEKINSISNKKFKIVTDANGVKQANQDLKSVNNTIKSTDKTSKSFKDTLKSVFSHFTPQTLIAYKAIGLIRKGFKEAVDSVKEINAALTEYKIVTGASNAEAYQLFDKANKQAKQYGATTKELIKINTEWARQGKSQAEIEKLTQDSIILSKTALMDEADAVQYLTATLNGYHLAAEQGTNIVDKYAKLDSSAAITAEGLAKASSRAADLARDSQITIDKYFAYLTTMNEAVQPDDTAMVGTAMKTILARMRDIKAEKLELIDEDGTTELLSNVETTLKNVGIDLRKTITEFDSSEAALDSLAEKWDTLSSTQQAALSKAFAGVRQQNFFRALMSNYDRVKKLADISANSTGTAQEKFEAYTDSIEAKSKSMQAAFESLANNSLSSETVKNITDATTEMIKFVDETNLLNGIVTGGFAVGLIKGFTMLRIGIATASMKLNQFSTALKLVKTGNLGQAEIQQLATLTANLSQNQLKAVLSSKALTAEQRIAILTAQGLSKSEAEAALSSMGLATAEGTAAGVTKSLSGTLKGLWATIKANPIGIIFTAISAAVMAFNSYNDSIENSRKATIESADEARQKIESLENSLKSYLALNDSASEEERANALKSVTEQIQNKTKALKDATGAEEDYAHAVLKSAAADYEEAAKKAKDARVKVEDAIINQWAPSAMTYLSEYKGEDEEVFNIASQFIGSNHIHKKDGGVSNFGIETDVEGRAKSLENYLTFYEELLKAQDAIQQKALEMGEAGDALLNSDLYKSFKGIIDNEDYRKNFEEYIKNYSDEIYDTAIAKNGIPETLEDLNKLKSAMLEQAGDSTALADAITNKLNTAFGNLADTANNTADEVSNADFSIDADTFKQQIEDLTKEIKEISKAYESLNGIVEDYNANGNFSLDNLETLAELGDDYVNCLFNENGQLQLNKDSFVELAKAKVEDIRYSMLQNAISQINALSKEDETVATADLADSTEKLTEKTLMLAAANKLAEGVSPEKVKAIIDTYSRWDAVIDSVIEGLDNNTDATFNLKQANEKLKDSINAEKESLEQEKQTLEDHKKALEDTKDGYEKAIDSISDLIAWTEKYIKQIKEDEITALEEKKNAIDDSIDKQKELLQAERDRIRQENELADKQNAVAKNALQADILSLDDSSAGKKAKKQADEKLKESRKDLTDTLNEQSYERRVEQLDKMKEENDKYYEKEIDSIKSFLDNEVAVYKYACAMIDNDNGELYSKLLWYCQNYTTTTEAEFNHMWNSAQSAMEQYNTANISTFELLNSLQGGIYEVDSAINTVADGISSYESRIQGVQDRLTQLSDSAVTAMNDIAAAIQAEDKWKDVQAYKPKWYYNWQGNKYNSFKENKDDAISDILRQISAKYGGVYPASAGTIYGTIKHYATGSKSAKGGLSEIDENGIETLMKKTPNGDYVIMDKGDQVFTKEQTDKLHEISQNPSPYINFNLDSKTIENLKKRGIEPLSSEELADLGLNTVVDLSQAKTQSFNFPDLADKIKNGVVDNSVGNIGKQDNSQNININNVFNGDVTPQMLRLLEQKEREIVAKATKASHNDFIETTLKGRKWR